MAKAHARKPARTDQFANESLLDFIVRVSPKYTAPKHLQPFASLIERALREPVRAVVSMPPRHGKTETELHSIAWTLARDPRRQICFAGYAATFAEKKSRKARELAIKAGVPIASDASARKDWRTGVDDGGCWATSIGGPITGEGFHLMIVDDPVKDRATAESAVFREHHYEWFNDVAFTRLEPNGSCIVTQTRWHPDDLAGRLIADGWECINLPAVDDHGASLWPERWPVERLSEIREQLGEYGWSSLYQGSPRPRGGAVFGDVHFYDQRPTTGYRVVIGLDFAYTAKTHADYSVAVVLAELKGTYYVLDVVRQQVTAPDFKGRIAQLKTTYGATRCHIYTGGTEQGVVDMMRASGLYLEATPARQDKFLRAQPVAAAWNAGKVLVPRFASWSNAFIEELASFTGVSDKHDDQIDALAGAFAIVGPSAAAKLDDFKAFQSKAPRARF